MNLILSFWAYSVADGRNPKPVWAIIAGNGYILGWSVSKRHAIRESGKYGDQHGRLSLVRMAPNV
jgi:hypothetical protein